VTDPISNSTPVSDVLGRTPTKPKTGGADLGQDAFLKLLVAQLKYQDPSSPADGTQFLAQTAQFTQLEKITQMVNDQQSMLAGQHILSAGSLVGQTVSFPAADGTTQTGVVTSATVLGSEPTLKIGDWTVPLSAVTEIRQTAPSA
jgi:flagellar basal-body rod modification protein FlgD